MGASQANTCCNTLKLWFVSGLILKFLFHKHVSIKVGTKGSIIFIIELFFTVTHLIMYESIRFYIKWKKKTDFKERILFVTETSL